MLKKCRNPMERNATVLRKITGFMFTFGWHATLRITKALAERDWKQSKSRLCE